MEEVFGAVAVELTPDDLRDIDTAASQITVQGARYPEKLEKMTGLDLAQVAIRLPLAPVLLNDN